MATRVINVASLSFCPYHLPWSPADLQGRCEQQLSETHPDRKKLKDKWNQREIDEFTKDVIDRMFLSDISYSVCNLDGVVFPADLIWPESRHWLRPLSANYSIFIGAVTLLERKIKGQAVFKAAEFRGLARFDRTQFLGAIDLSEAKFISGVSFVGAEFLQSANFSGLYASKLVDFTGAAFHRGLACIGATFIGPVDFVNAEFHMHSRFTSTTFAAGVNFRCHKQFSPSFPRAEFQSARFLGPVSFENREFGSTLDFTNAEFAQALNLHDCDLHQDTVFPSIDGFRDIRVLPSFLQRVPRPTAAIRGYYGGAARAYRTLRLHMKGIEAHDEEAMFWELESRAKRLATSPLREPLTVVLSYLYSFTNAYGNNPARPLGIWVALTLAFPLMFYPPLAESLSSRMSLLIPDRLDFSLQQTVRPFAVWNSEGVSTIKHLFANGANRADISFMNAEDGTQHVALTQATENTSSDILRVRLLASAQSVLSVAVIALFLFALRRKFRMA
jgi:uncharacterized protein YjbI with pentapeptide repeats